MSEGMEPESLVMVALTMPLSRVQDLPLSVTVTGAAGDAWARRSDGEAASATRATWTRAASREKDVGRNIFIGETPLERRGGRAQRRMTA